MATSDFLPFATDPSANVITQSDYNGLAARLYGFKTGRAISSTTNKAIRQGAFAAATLFQFLANQLGTNIYDDGDLPGAVTNLTNALQYSAAATGQTVVKNTSFAVTAADNRNVFVANTAITATIPVSTSLSTSWRTDYYALGGAITVAKNAADTLNGAGVSIIIPIGYKGTVVTDGAGKVFLLVDSIGTAAQWTHGSNTNGYWRKAPDGFIEQWGYKATSNSTFTFPIAFTAAKSDILLVVGNTSSQGGFNDNAYGYVASDTTFFAATKSSEGSVTNYPISWSAKGY